MARKRMFDTEIITQDSFLDLPMESKALYFLLGMEADDDGFINPNKVLRLYGGTQDAIKVLIAKEYIIPFKSGVVVITDWNTNNWLDKRRTKSTIYLKEKSLIKVDKNTNKYVVAKPMLSECLESIEENSIEEYIPPISPTEKKSDELETEIEILNPIEINFNKFWEMYPKKKAKETAFKSFKKINPNKELLNTMLSQLELFTKTKDWLKDKGQFIPYPATWLNQKRWEDEIKKEDLKEITTKDLADKYDWSDF